MTDNKSLFTSLLEYNKRKVNFGDDATTKICNKGIIDFVSVHNLENIL